MVWNDRFVFPSGDMGDKQAEIVHSLAKWKRLTLADYERIEEGFGIYTDMNAIRADEELDNLHSLYVDQWDWELVIGEEERTVEYLKSVVRRIHMPPCYAPNTWSTSYFQPSPLSSHQR